MKECKKCNIIKSLNDFNKDKKAKDGHRNDCKDCKKLYKNNWYTVNSKDQIRKTVEWHKNNKPKIPRYIKKFKIKSNKCYNERMRKYQKAKRKDDIQFRLSKNLRSRLSIAIKNDQKIGSAISDLGCTIEELKKHLESQFNPNFKKLKAMSWDNYGVKGWHIDHIKPLASFDLTNREELLKACHYTNLQPMWAKENLSKGTKYLQV